MSLLSLNVNNYQLISQICLICTVTYDHWVIVSKSPDIIPFDLLVFQYLSENLKRLFKKA